MRSLIRDSRSPSALTTAITAAGAVDLEDQQVGLLLAGLLDALGQVRDHDRIERPFQLDPDRAQQLAERGVVEGRLAGDLIDGPQLVRIVGGPRAEALVASATRGQDAAQCRRPTPAAPR